MTAAVIYTRFSPRPNSQECDSCEKQEERCRAYCRHWGYDPCAVVFNERNASGGTLDRPCLRAAIDSLQQGDVLVVDSVDRLARDMLVTLTIRHEVERAGGRIEYANGTPVNETPEGRLFSNILAAFAAYERDRVRYATSRGMKRRQANGEWFGKPPVGFQLDPGCSTKLIECPDEIAALAVARTLKEKGLTWLSIEEYLNVNWQPFRGGRWKADTIRKALTRETS